jgi:MSHA biogenesis protein MshO
MAGAPLSHFPRPSGGVRGFSLVELIVVIVITGVIASVVGLFITGPIQAFIDQARRAELVDSAQLAMTRMGRDLRAALPNSVRINGGALELLLTLDGDRYRTETPGTEDDRLNFTIADTAFNTLVPFELPAGSTFPLADAFLAIYPLQQDGADPYDVADRVMTAAGTIAVSTVNNNGQNEGRVGLAAHRFKYDSPSRRVFLVEGPVTYLCNPPQLLRYEGYGVTAAQVVPPGGIVTVIAGNIQACAFDYDPGTATRNGVVSLALSLADATALTERIRLIRQIYVANTP